MNTRRLTGGSREGMQDKTRWARDEEEARGRYHGYSAGTAHSAARSTVVTNAATTAYADDA